jgi:hypothetical protein
MAYPYDNDDQIYGFYGYRALSEREIRERMDYAINGDESDSDDSSIDFGDLDDLDSDDDE